jgi:radical SAM superfamily enzyme YgiQ (UPF0313 family)
MKIDLYHLYRGFHFSKLAYPIVLDVLRSWAEARGWQARVSICPESQVDLETDADVIGFSVYSQTAPAIYRVAAELRKRGKIVLFGGPHFRGPSTLAEASPYCDLIASSICEEQMHEILGRIETGKLGHGGAESPAEPLVVRDLERRFRYPTNFHESLGSRRWYQIPSIPTSLGCPYDCSFCAAYRQGEYALREIDTIYNEMAAAPGKLTLICDATFGLNKKHTVELMSAIAPLRKKIGIETTLARLQDQQFLEALALGGVKWIVVGIETLGPKLRKHGSVRPHDGLVDVIERAQDLGMAIQGNFICGLDSDEPDFHERIFDYYEASKLDAIMMGILTPYPDTALYRQLASEGRILDPDWESYDCHHVVYQPRRMSVDQLIDGYIELYRRVRQHKSIFRELYEGLKAHGPSPEALVPVGNNTYQKFDSIKKRRHLRRNQSHLRRSQHHLRLKPHLVDASSQESLSSSSRASLESGVSNPSLNFP